MEALAVTGWLKLEEESSHSGEAEIISRAKRDPDAMAHLFRQHYSAIATYIRRRIGNHAVADDLTSEVFLTMVRCVPRYRITVAPFRAWLYRLATNQVNSWASRQSHRAWKELYDHPAPSREVDEAEEAEYLRSALFTLPVHYQSVLALHYLEEMSVETVAQVLGCAVGTVKSRLARGREMLKVVLSEQEQHHE